MVAVDQSVPGDAPQLHLRIHAINVFVRDQDASLRFYLDALGFSLIGDVRFESGLRWVAVAPPNGHAVLSLVAPTPESKDYELIGRPTEIVFITEDVVAKYHEWRSRGVKFKYVPRLKRLKYDSLNSSLSIKAEEKAPVWGGAITHFKDIDGNTFALISFDEVTRSIEVQRQAEVARLEAERRATQELEIAKQVQARLFPQSLPPLKTLDYAGLCIQARQVGGDYYDFLNLGPRFGLVLGDIAGKGIAGALLMANLQANLRSQCGITWGGPERLLKSVNQLFCENTADNAYATLFFAEYDDASQRLSYANCGHLSALLLHADGMLTRLESTCTVLGLFPTWDCCVRECHLRSGDTLVLYTDGVTESFSASGEEFGERRLVEALQLHRHLSAQRLASTMVEAVQNFSAHEQSDDITLVVAKCR